MSVQDTWKEKADMKIKEPARYQVVMYNDDFTPMDFVVVVLMEIFHKEENEAVALMYLVHQGGYAVVGTYSMDIATTKVRLTMERARNEGYPFKLKIEEA